MDLLQWGTVPEWIAAVGTAGALILTAITVRQEIAARRGADKEQEKAQATTVTAWVEVQPRDQEDLDLDRDAGIEPDPSDPLQTRQWVAMISNASGAPVYDAQVIVYAPHGPLRVNPLEFGTIAPGTTRTFPIQHANIAMAGNVVSGLQVEVAFIDAAGRNWRRNNVGQLERLNVAPSRLANELFQRSLSNS